jgi:hypothetical protein
LFNHGDEQAQRRRAGLELYDARFSVRHTAAAVRAAVSV